MTATRRDELTVQGTTGGSLGACNSKKNISDSKHYQSRMLESSITGFTKILNNSGSNLSRYWLQEARLSSNYTSSCIVNMNNGQFRRSCAACGCEVAQKRFIRIVKKIKKTSDLKLY